MGRILIPATSSDDWRQFLAKPEIQWKSGYSARALAHCWQAADGIPDDVHTVLMQAPTLQGLEAAFCIPEHQTPLPGGSQPSQSDVWVLATTTNGLVSIAVEGKVSESFGPTIGDWKTDTSPGKDKRLRFLCSELALPFPPRNHFRYQLFHRTASAVIEAKRFHATDAVMVIHTFSPTDEWLSDYQDFLGLLELTGGVNEVASKQLADGPRLHLAWVHGSAEWLQA